MIAPWLDAGGGPSLAMGRKPAPSAPAASCPLAVDLDGTLVTTDTLHEAVLAVLKAPPRTIASVLAALPAGKAAFKRRVALAAPPDPAMLPYNAALLAWLRTEHAAGRRIGLFTAADQAFADAVGAHLDMFDVVRGSDPGTNLGGAAKAAAIEAAFGPRFAYAGDHPVDLPIFARCQSVVLAGRGERLRSRLGGAPVEASFPTGPAGLRAWVHALRLRHWVKNVLLFVALVLGAPTGRDLAEAAWLFVLLGLVASGTYLLNDLLDLPADRAHPHKRFRPFAAGLIPVSHGVAVAVALIGAALAGSLVLPLSCTAMLLAYLGLTLLYSLALKRVPTVDVTVLAGLFTLRVLGGSLVLGTRVSPWLLTFSMLFFLGLAVIKRYAELQRVLAVAPDAEVRGYVGEDVPMLMASGIASGFAAIVIFMIYLITEQYPRAVYPYPDALWCIMPILLMWTLRLWHLAVRGQMSEDPVMFAVRDRFSLVLAALSAAVLVVARL